VSVSSLLSRRRRWRRALAKASRRAGTARSGLDPSALTVVHEDLETRAAAWAADPDGRAAVRTELMDSIDRIMLNGALLALKSEEREAVRRRMPQLPRSDPELRRNLEADRLRLRVLRHWTGLVFRDRARGDWFDVYQRAAEMRRESLGRDLERLAGTPVHAAEHHRDAAIRGLNTALRLRLLQAPPRARIGKRRRGLRLPGPMGRFYHARSDEEDSADND